MNCLLYDPSVNFNNSKYTVIYIPCRIKLVPCTYSKSKLEYDVKPISTLIGIRVQHQRNRKIENRELEKENEKKRKREREREREQQQCTQ